MSATFLSKVPEQLATGTSDVILHISYTTKEDGRFKSDVESELVDQFKELASGEGLSRSYSLKREFASALNQLQHPLAGTPRETELRLDKRHFPYFLRDQTIELVGATLILQPKETAAFNISGLELVLNNNAGGLWVPFPDNSDSLMANSFEINEPLNPEGNTWSLRLNQGDLSQLQDMWLIVGYRIR
jgi:hypothetical protein